MCPYPKPIRFVHQQINPLPPLQHPLNILRHNPLHVINILLHIRNRILLPPLRSPIPNHQPLQLSIKTRRTICRHGCKIRTFRIIAREKLLLYFHQVAEGYAAAEAAGGDDEVGQAAGGGVGGGVVRGGVGDVVDVVLVVGVGELLGLVVGDFGEDEGGEAGGLGGGGGGVFG